MLAGPPKVPCKLKSTHPRGFDRTLDKQKEIKKKPKESLSLPAFMENLSPLFAEWDKILGDPVSYDTRSDPGTVPLHPYNPLWDDDELV